MLPPRLFLSHTPTQAHTHARAHTHTTHKWVIELRTHPHVHTLNSYTTLTGKLFHSSYYLVAMVAGEASSFIGGGEVAQSQLGNITS